MIVNFNIIISSLKTSNELISPQSPSGDSMLADVILFFTRYELFLVSDAREVSTLNVRAALISS